MLPGKPHFQRAFERESEEGKNLFTLRFFNFISFPIPFYTFGVVRLWGHWGQDSQNVHSITFRKSQRANRQRHQKHFPLRHSEPNPLALPRNTIYPMSLFRINNIFALQTRSVRPKPDELYFIISFSLCFYLSANKPWKLIAFPSSILPRHKTRNTANSKALSAYFLHTNKFPSNNFPSPFKAAR